MIPVTMIITDNNRPDLLRRTLDSFFALNTYPLHKIHLHNDGTDKFMRKLMPLYPQIEWHFSGKIIGYAASLDFLIAKVETPYFFSCESDWHFYQNPGFIEKSLTILENNPDIHQVWIRKNGCHNHPLSEPRLESGIEVQDVIPGYRRHWNGWSWNPALRRTADIRRFFPKGLVQYRDEIDQARHVAKFNYKAVALFEPSIEHIGWHRRSINFKA